MNHIGLRLIWLALSLSASGAAAEVVAVVSSNNPVTTLSRHQVVDIFLGKTRQFPDGRRAVPVDQMEGSTTRDEFYRKFADWSPAQIKAYWSKVIFTGRGQPPPEVSNDLQVIEFIVKQSGAIGYIEDEMADSNVRVLRAQ